MARPGVLIFIFLAEAATPTCAQGVPAQVKGGKHGGSTVTTLTLERTDRRSEDGKGTYE